MKSVLSPSCILATNSRPSSRSWVHGWALSTACASAVRDICTISPRIIAHQATCSKSTTNTLETCSASTKPCCPRLQFTRRIQSNSPLLQRNRRRFRFASSVATSSKRSILMCRVRHSCSKKPTLTRPRPSLSTRMPMPTSSVPNYRKWDSRISRCRARICLPLAK